MDVLICTLFFVTQKQSIQTECKITWCCWSSSITHWQRTWLLQHDWSRSKFLLAWSCDWTSNLSLCKKTFLPSIFNLIAFWNSMSLNVLDIKLTEKNIIKELGLSIDVSEQGFPFCPPKTYKPNKQTTWNTSHIHGIAWISGKLDYDKHFAVFYDVKVMNAEVFAKGLEKCWLSTRLLGRKVENLDDYDCPKIQYLVAVGKTNSSWMCSSHPFRHKTRLHCAERKAKVYGEWAMQHLIL